MSNYHRARRLEELRDEIERITGGTVVSVLPSEHYVDVTVRVRRT